LAADIAQAKALGYRIRLIGLAEIDGKNGAATIFQRVQPCLVPLAHPLAHVMGATNAVVAEGNFSGRLLFQGAGAGDKPTASAVVADLVDIARKETGPAFSMPCAELEDLPRAASAHRVGKSYLRMVVADRVGVLAEITAAMRDAGLSIESLIQTEAADDGSALIAMVTHEGPEQAVDDTLNTLSTSDSLMGEPMVMHILSE
jgi:homoserine dehydrogenase